MKKLALITTSLVSAILLSNAAHAVPASINPVPEEGSVTVTGKVVGGTCELQNNQILVALSDANRSELTEAGKTAKPKAFSIKFKNCSVGDTIALSVTDASVIDTLTGNPKNSADDAANNVQIQLTNADGQAINLTHDFAPIAAIKGVNRFDFKAQYFATGMAGLGNVQGYIPFKVTYN